MDEKADFRPQKFAVIGAGPVGCIVAAYLARGGHDVTLCDVVPQLVNAAHDPGIRHRRGGEFPPERCRGR